MARVRICQTELQVRSHEHTNKHYHIPLVGTNGLSMGVHGHPWASVGVCGRLWTSVVVVCRHPWVFADVYGHPWASEGVRGRPGTRGHLWLVDARGCPWTPVGAREHPHAFFDVRGHPLTPVGVRVRLWVTVGVRPWRSTDAHERPWAYPWARPWTSPWIPTGMPANVSTRSPKMVYITHRVVGEGEQLSLGRVTCR